MPFDEDHIGMDLMRQTVDRNTSAALPEIWLETGGNGGLPVNKADAFWDTLNVYNFARSDMRMVRAMGQDNETYVGVSNTGTAWGNSLAEIHLAQGAEWRTRWGDIGKAFKVIPLIVGTDSADSPVDLITHPTDDLGDGTHSFFKDAGIAETAAFVSLAASVYRGRLTAGRAAEVVATMDDLEQFGQMGGTTNNNAVNGLVARNLADARAGSSPVNNNGDTLETWLSGRTTKLDGTPLTAWNASYTGFHPNNWEAERTADEADCCVNAYATYQAIAKQFQAQFVNALRHGSWRFTNASRDFPALYRPDQYRYLMDGDFAHGYSVPANYRDITDNPWRTEAATLPDTDYRIATVERVSAWLGIGTNQDRAAADFNIRLCRSIGAIPGHKLFPSIQISGIPGTLGDATYTAARNHMIRWMVDAGRYANAERFWLFCPSYNSDATERARVADFVAAFNAAWTA